ncbi:MAG: hypothetical protein IJU98_11350 [Synergistaceae bacterium]|nr:hypothetical protein [Synergistaceae bacterium]
MELKNIEELVDRLSEKIESLLTERDNLKQEVDRLTRYAAERDEECVRVRQEMAQALEAAAEETTRLEHSETQIEAKLQDLNNRLISLAMEQHPQGGAY